MQDPVAAAIVHVLPSGFDVMTCERGANPELACPTVMVALPSPATTEGVAGGAGADAVTFTVTLSVDDPADDLNWRTRVESGVSAVVENRTDRKASRQ